MIFSSRINSKDRLLAGALIMAHLVTCFFVSWFHQHPEQDHAEVKGSAYHSHVSGIASGAQKSNEVHHDLKVVLHLLEGSQLFEKTQSDIAAYFAQIFIPSKFVPQKDFFVSPFVENSPPNSVVKAVLKLPPSQPARDYFALTATGLSPPLA